ncbi:MAG: UDP-N-acetylglucosamine--N-acetylmuramyl-(pentapeptide) pyrophosphoryl-undecaprenol N-acetylglucosamine transferase [Acidimicrobiales bacterium]
MTRGPFVVISGGGTGGHVFLALAIACALRARGHEPETIELVGSRRGQEALLLDGQDFPLTLLPGRGVVRRLDPASLRANVGAVTGLLSATIHEVLDLALRRPRVVVSVGGYASFPADAAALVLGVPLVLVTIDAVPGAVHRLLGRRAAANAVAFPGTGLPGAVVTGVPVRPEIAEIDRSPEGASRARKELEIPEGRRVVGIVGGSLGARRLNAATLDLAERWRCREDRALYHVVGRRDAAQVRGEAGARGLGAGGKGLSYRLVDFEDRMARLYEAVDVLVCRAGASTVAELTVAGVPSVLVPLPGAPGDHQSANARVLVGEAAAMLVPDAACNVDGLSPVLDELLDDPERLRSMGAAARALGRPDAADRISEMVLSHAR